MKNKNQGSLIRRQNELQEKKKVSVFVRPQDGAPVLDAALLRLLHGAPSSLAPIAELLRWTEDEDGGQSLLLQVRTSSELHPEASRRPPQAWRLLQTLSSQLDVLSAELSRRSSELSGVLGVQPCLDDVFRVLAVIRASLAFREKQLRDLKQDNVQVSPVAMDTG